MKTVLVIIANHKEPRISEQVVASALELVFVEPNLIWLNPGLACEIPCSMYIEPNDPYAEMKVRGYIGPNLDFAFVPASNRRKRLLIADMDSTIIEQECIDELAEVAGVGDRIKAITERAMRGELEFVPALKERVRLLQGLAGSDVQRVLRERITLRPGGRTLVATMRAQGASTALVSGGFSIFTNHVASAVGFEHQRANELLFSDGKLTGEVAEPILGKDAKVEALEQLCSDRGLAPRDALAVGDGANDIPMLERSGLGVAFHAKPAVREAAKAVIDHGDLTALLYLQGYRREEFVTRS